MSPEGAEEIVPAVVVVVADADAGLPTGSCESRFRGDIGKGPVAVVLVKVGRRSLARRPLHIETVAVCEIDVQPAVIVVIEERNATAFCFDDGAFVIDSSPDIRSGEPSLRGDVGELHREVGAVVAA